VVRLCFGLCVGVGVWTGEAGGYRCIDGHTETHIYIYIYIEIYIYIYIYINMPLAYLITY